MKLPFVIGTALILSGASALAQSPDSSQAQRPAPAHDAVFGLDKPKHFLLSAFIESATFAGLQAGGASRRTAMSGGLSAASVFAIGREIHDRRTKGLFSFGDLVWDALGAGAATVMLRHTYR
jgi:uncharacterized protein YfiM (DUF2279 family)